VNTKSPRVMQTEMTARRVGMPLLKMHIISKHKNPELRLSRFPITQSAISRIEQ
jgi:hypothetical protein